MYEIVFSRQVLKTLRKLPGDLVQRMREKLEQIAADPHGQHKNATKLTNRPGYRLRVGDWRIIYEVQDDQLRILVLKIAPRGEVYR
jgi:mRNA interferase RelE/StbE